MCQELNSNDPLFPKNFRTAMLHYDKSVLPCILRVSGCAAQ